MKWYGPTSGQFVSEMYTPNPSGNSAKTLTKSTAGETSTRPVRVVRRASAVDRRRRRVRSAGGASAVRAGAARRPVYPDQSLQGQSVFAALGRGAEGAG